MQATKQAIQENTTLKEDFYRVCQVRIQAQQIVCPRKLVDDLYNELLSRVVNTMMNSLLQTAAVLDRIKSDKGVDADVALRDKLKVYASQTKSSVKL